MELVKLRTSNAYRKEKQRVLLEGYNCIQDVVKVHVPLRVFVTENCTKKLPVSCPTYVVTDEVMKKISSVKTPEGIVAEFSMPPMHTLSRMTHIIVCDTVSDPGNLGTLIRTAYALGWEGIFLLEGSCDLFNDKALRAAKGATFMLPWRRGSWEELSVLIAENQLTLLVADMKGEPPEHFSGKRVALLLGNEAHGIRGATSDYEKVAISMHGAIDSLNVAIAGAILMYTLRKQ